MVNSFRFGIFFWPSFISAHSSVEMGPPDDWKEIAKLEGWVWPWHETWLNAQKKDKHKIIKSNCFKTTKFKIYIKIIWDIIVLNTFSLSHINQNASYCKKHFWQKLSLRTAPMLLKACEATKCFIHMFPLLNIDNHSLIMFQQNTLLTAIGLEDWSRWYWNYASLHAVLAFTFLSQSLIIMWGIL